MSKNIAYSVQDDVDHVIRINTLDRESSEQVCNTNESENFNMDKSKNLDLDHICDTFEPPLAIPLNLKSLCSFILPPADEGIISAVVLSKWDDIMGPQTMLHTPTDPIHWQSWLVISITTVSFNCGICVDNGFGAWLLFFANYFFRKIVLPGSPFLDRLFCGNNFGTGLIDSWKERRVGAGAWSQGLRKSCRGGRDSGNLEDREIGLDREGARKEGDSIPNVSECKVLGLQFYNQLGYDSSSRFEPSSSSSFVPGCGQPVPASVIGTTHSLVETGTAVPTVFLVAGIRE
uniref:Uncharacterized protein n=1 Tax=Timema monikensis TaxID=170555 RepID=A0A7R9EJU0_9NEOP|nr:unnamed protein product [Timema monikensis]